MSIRLKIIVAALAAVFVLLLMILWAVFVYNGRTAIDPFINQIGALITIAVGLIAAFFGHQSAAGGSTVLPAQFATIEASQPLTAPLPRMLVDPSADPAVAAAPAPSPVPQPAAGASTLQ